MSDWGKLTYLYSRCVVNALSHEWLEEFRRGLSEELSYEDWWLLPDEVFVAYTWDNNTNEDHELPEQELSPESSQGEDQPDLFDSGFTTHTLTSNKLALIEMATVRKYCGLQLNTSNRAKKCLFDCNRNQITPWTVMPLLCSEWLEELATSSRRQ